MLWRPYKLVLKDVWTKLKETDPRLVIYPWSKESAKVPGLTKVEELPDKVPAIQEFFDRAFPRKAGGTMYVSVFLGHDKPFQDMHSELDWWLVGQGYGWYLKALQCEKSVVIGWLLFSTIDMDREVLAEEIRQLTGVEVGLRFRTISVKTRSALSKEQMVAAIHVEVDEQQLYEGRASVQDLYRATWVEGFPLDMKMRLCPPIQDLTDPASLAKLERLRLRQAAFLANVEKTINYELGSLDYVDPQLDNWTLRRMIMSIQDNDGVRVFVSVDKHFLGKGHVFQYTSKYSSLVRLS